MKHLIILGGLILAVALLMSGIAALPPPFVAAATPTIAAGTTPDLRGTLEWEIRDASAPYPDVVIDSDNTQPWFGWAGANLYFSWTPGDGAAIFYLPPPECQVNPQKQCGSICPPTGNGCFTATVVYRWPRYPDVRTILRLPNNLPFPEGDPGDPVVLVPDGAGRLRWVLP